MPKSKGSHPAVADWEFGAAGTRVTQRIYDVSVSQHRDGSVVFRDAAGDIALIVSLAPGMFLQRRDRKLSVPPQGTPLPPEPADG